MRRTALRMRRSALRMRRTALRMRRQPSRSNGQRARGSGDRRRESSSRIGRRSHRRWNDTSRARRAGERCDSRGCRIRCTPGRIEVGCRGRSPGTLPPDQEREVAIDGLGRGRNGSGAPGSDWLPLAGSGTSSRLRGLRRLGGFRVLRRLAIGPARATAASLGTRVLPAVGVVAETAEERVETDGFVSARCATGGSVARTRGGRVSTDGAVGLLGSGSVGRPGVGPAPGRGRVIGLLGGGIRGAEDGVEAGSLDWAHRGRMLRGRLLNARMLRGRLLNGRTAAAWDAAARLLHARLLHARLLHAQLLRARLLHARLPPARQLHARLRHRRGWHRTLRGPVSRKCCTIRGIRRCGRLPGVGVRRNRSLGRLPGGGILCTSSGRERGLPTRIRGQRAGLPGCAPRTRTRIRGQRAGLPCPASTSASASARPGGRVLGFEPKGLGRLSFPDLPSRQGSFRPQWDLCAWRRTVGHEGGLEHVGNLRRIGGGTGRR